MKFLTSLAAGANSAGQGAGIGASIGQAVGAVASASAQRVAIAENKKTLDAYADVRARRMAKRMRALEGQARVAMQGGSYGSNLFIAADNARNAEENRQSVYLNAQLRKNDQDARKPNNAAVAAKVVSGLLGASAKAAGASYTEVNL